MKKHHDKFMADDKLRQLFHEYDTNIVEGFDKFLTNFLSKDRTYCNTIKKQSKMHVSGWLTKKTKKTENPILNIKRP